MMKEIIIRYIKYILSIDTIGYIYIYYIGNYA